MPDAIASSPRSRDASTTDGIEVAWQIIQDGCAAGAFAGAVALVKAGDEVVFHRATGWAVREPGEIPMDKGTIFDLASLTKVVATLPSILVLVDRGALRLDDPVGAILPQLGRDGFWQEVTVRRLLTHHAGLPAWLPLYLDNTGPTEYLAAIAKTEPAAAPGTDVIYSDLGFILLGEIVRRVSGLDVAAFAADAIFGPLGMVDTFYAPPAARRERIAATERGNETEIGMCGERGVDFPRWRREMIWGEVNDGNAYYGLGGVSGHAGLFSTAGDLARFGRFWLQGGAWDGRQIITESLLTEATREQAPGRGLGWRLPGFEADPLDIAHVVGPGSYAHNGFTGTSLAIDPNHDLVIVLLTNRLHPVARAEIVTIRPAFHAAVMSAFEEAWGI